MSTLPCAEGGLIKPCKVSSPTIKVHSFCAAEGVRAPLGWGIAGVKSGLLESHGSRFGVDWLGVALLFSPLPADIVRSSEARMPAMNEGSDNKGASATARSTMG